MVPIDISHGENGRESVNEGNLGAGVGGGQRSMVGSKSPAGEGGEGAVAMVEMVRVAQVDFGGSKAGARSRKNGALRCDLARPRLAVLQGIRSV